MNMKSLRFSRFIYLALMMPSLAFSQETQPAQQKGAVTQAETERCKPIIAAMKAPPATPPAVIIKDVGCEVLNILSYDTLVSIDPREYVKQSLDKKISCVKKASYTYDYAACERAINYYNYVIAAETAMDLQQKIRTDLKNKNIQEQATKQAASGDVQTGMFDAAIESNKHQKSMQQEKMLAYGAAVGALVAAYRTIPGVKEVLQKCTAGRIDAKTCENTISSNKTLVLSNEEAKASLALAIATFTAKGLAAGIAMGQYNTTANQIAAAKATTAETQEDLMMERCAFNPNDPACVKATAGTGLKPITGGNFALDEGAGNNNFNMTPGADAVIDPSAISSDENAPIAAVNSPFEDDAKKAKSIMDPAAAAQMQATGGAAGGGGGGGGGLGGGSASLGGDLAGADKDGDKEASIKTNSVGGTYSAAGGGGFKGVGGSKDDANPFSSLFDAKSDGGIEEDRSIASGDIDGGPSGLFEKISKRYSQIQADKRIEAKNLE
jgi:hypothetical protein